MRVFFVQDSLDISYDDAIFETLEEDGMYKLKAFSSQSGKGIRIVMKTKKKKDIDDFFKAAHEGLVGEKKWMEVKLNDDDTYEFTTF